MPDNVDPATRSRTMSRVRSTNTTPERSVRRLLHRAGYRFRLHRKDLPGKPDLVLPRYRTAVFVHGCFWHWHGCKRSRMPSSNREYWIAKIRRNTERDQHSRERLEALGWSVAVIWECSIERDTALLLHRLCHTSTVERDARASSSALSADSGH